MSFLDEQEEVTTNDPKKAKELQDAGVKNIRVVDEMVKEANAFLAAADAARDAGKKEFEFPKGSGKMHKVTLKRDLDVKEGRLSKALGGLAVLSSLILMNKINSSDPVVQRLKAEYEQADPAQQDSIQKLITKRLIFLDTGKFDDNTPMKENKTCGCGQTPCKTYGKMKEDKDTVELPADTTFTLDLKHLMKKHMDEGKSQEDVVKLTKALMKKLHDKGEVIVKGTKVIFKEVKKKKSGYMGYTELAEDDTQLALPEPDAPDFLGADGKDYEGGMAKSQMLKMKKYAMALCDMVDDETQLEAWVQAKITKASDYMSSVYHYLDYQKSKMNEAFELNGRKVVDLEADGGGSSDPFIGAAYYLDTGEALTDDEIEDLVNKYPADLELGGAWWDQQR